MLELSQHILDVLENSLEAGASKIELEIVEDRAVNRLTISATDDGRGMDSQTLSRVTDPFFTTRTTRHVGLGVPLFKAAAQRCDGDLVVTSEPGFGTRVMASFRLDHIDRAPLGDMGTTLISIIVSRRDCDLHYLHRVGCRRFEFSTEEMRRLLGDVPLTDPTIREWVEDCIREGLADLHGRAAN